MDTAQALDNKRLGKQRVECLQILNTLTGKSSGWRHHPAVLMWRGHERLLASYARCMIWEWTKARGFKNTIDLSEFEKTPLRLGYYPAWFGDEKIIKSHMSNLLRKDPAHYGQFCWGVPDNLPYHWPVTRDDLILEEVLQFAV